jgi:hypothetical protein
MVGQFFTDNSSFWEALLEPCFFLLGMMCGEWGGWRKVAGEHEGEESQSVLES